MNKIQWIIVILSIITLLGGTVTILCGCSGIQERNYLHIQDDGIYFGMSKARVSAIKGKPVETAQDIMDTPVLEYAYEENISGYPAQSSYHFIRSRLVDVMISIPEIDFQQAQELVNALMDAQKEQYAQYNGYHCDDFESDEPDSFHISHGVSFGATGISYLYSYSSGTLSITAVMQE